MEFTGLMENMTKPTEELASTLEAFRVFDVEGAGTISSESIRSIMHKSLEQIPGTEIDEILENLGLIQDRVVTLEGNVNLCVICSISLACILRKEIFEKIYFCTNRKNNFP